MPDHTPEILLDLLNARAWIEAAQEPTAVEQLNILRWSEAGRLCLPLLLKRCEVLIRERDAARSEAAQWRSLYLAANARLTAYEGSS